MPAGRNPLNQIRRYSFPSPQATQHLLSCYRIAVMSLSTYPDLWAAQTRVLDRSSTKDMEVKMEPNGLVVNGHEGHIKVEPPSAAASPAAHSDDDLYEDAGDLDFSRTAQGLYLTRIPKYLWESWSTLDDEEEIQIGTVRVEGGLEDVKRVILLLQ